uniref:Uncharacterized protein n=1 Tax=Manihot esculenta TaxID=3983 RepID=A0A2C9UMU8_MANES
MLILLQVVLHLQSDWFCMHDRYVRYGHLGASSHVHKNRKVHFFHAFGRAS